MIGPATDKLLATVTPVVLLALPSVRLEMVLPNVQPLVEKVLPKVLANELEPESGSTVTAPVVCTRLVPVSTSMLLARSVMAPLCWLLTLEPNVSVFELGVSEMPWLLALSPAVPVMVSADAPLRILLSRRILTPWLLVPPLALPPPVPLMLIAPDATSRALSWTP